MDILERARELHDSGKHRAAIGLLKPAALADVAPFEKRRALAEMYRARGLPDQAGRWGILVEGWTTAHERDRLARAIAGGSMDRTTTASFLSIPAGFPRPLQLVALVDDVVPDYRKKFRARSAAPLKPPVTRPSDAASKTSFVLGLLAALGCFIAPLIVYVVVLAGGTGVRVAAILMGEAVVLLAGASAAASGVSRLLERRPRSGIPMLAGGLAVMVAVVLAAFFFAPH